MVTGSDGKLYGCTYPNAKLVSYDPATGALADLGRLDPTEQYARLLVANNAGFLYSYVGYTKNHLVAYEIATGQHQDILPPDLAGYSVSLAQGIDGTTYALIHSQWYSLSGFTITPIAATQVHPLVSQALLPDGRSVSSYANGSLSVFDPVTNKTITYSYRYPGKELAPFRLGLGPDGLLYGNTVLPNELFSLNPAAPHVNTIGQIGSGETYAMLSVGSDLVLGSYSSLAPIMTYTPGLAFAPGKTSGANPFEVFYSGYNAGWRPEAILKAPNNHVYFGAVPGYGLLGGSLVDFDPSVKSVVSSQVVIPDQSIVTLAVAPNGHIIGGTSITGGGGSIPTATEAKLFEWDPVSNTKVFDTVPVAGATGIDDLLALPNGMIYSLAGMPNGTFQAFVYNPSMRTVIAHPPLPNGFAINGSVYNAIGLNENGFVYGLSTNGIFKLDPNSYTLTIEAVDPAGTITAGFAMVKNEIYLAAGIDIQRYVIK